MGDFESWAQRRCEVAAGGESGGRAAAGALEERGPVGEPPGQRVPAPSARPKSDVDGGNLLEAWTTELNKHGDTTRIIK